MYYMYSILTIVKGHALKYISHINVNNIWLKYYGDLRENGRRYN